LRKELHQLLIRATADRIDRRELMTAGNNNGSFATAIRVSPQL